MRIVYWNIERGYHPDAIVQQLKALDADIYLLCELDRGVKRTNGVDMFTRIQEGLEMHGKYIREFEEIDSIWRRIIPWGGPGGGGIGNAVFSRYPIYNYRTIDLPVCSPLVYDRSTWIPELFKPRSGRRKAQIFQVDVEGVQLTIASMHLELWRSDWNHRREQLESAIREVKEENFILAGDFNSVGGALFATLFRRPGLGEVKKTRNWLKQHDLEDPFLDSDTTSGRLGIRAKLDWIAATKKNKRKGCPGGPASPK